MSLKMGVALLILAALPLGAQEQAGTAKAASVAKRTNPATGTAAAKIASAMSAAPSRIASGATIAEIGADGKVVVLRPGTNGFTCFPDDPNTPKSDPICADKMWSQWYDAWMAKKPPMIKQVGIAYMLQGASDASNTDPFATKPAAGAEWVNTPAHTMVIVPDPKQLDSYPSDPKSGGPFVMFKGTPYAHLMVPTH
ncbi:MAG TPA: hypothetical protein VF461_07880 [Gemmatimonadaceae bacterium]